MTEKIKFFLSVFILVIFAFACSRFNAERNSDKQQQQQKQTKKEEPEKKDQYRIAENFKDNKSQIIDLIEGPATFDIKYEGNSNFNVRVLNSDGTVLDVLADVTGSYKGTKTITVPKTSSYILDVKCQGTWSVYRK
jgi:hypothetical protein